MELRIELKDNLSVTNVISKFRKLSKSGAEDAVVAYNLMFDNNKNPDALEHRVHMVDIMCTYMDPGVEDVVAMLLYNENIHNVLPQRVFEQFFREKRAKFYYEWTIQACRNAEINEEILASERIEFYIMMRVCDKMQESMIRVMNKSGIPDTVLISKAYTIARNAHYWANRKSGEPYMTHPVRVAGILAKVGVESPIIAAALLHDVAEDTDHTLDYIAKECGERVAGYVDAVTSLHKQYLQSHNSYEYSLDKDMLDAKSFEKLVGAVLSDSNMVFALYIKAADRIHNLSTIDDMPMEKRRKKNDETELDYLPLFKRFKLNYFVNIIEDLMWRNSDIKRYDEFESRYRDMVERNADFVDEMKNILSANLGEEFNRRCVDMLDIPGYDVSVSPKFYRPLEVYNFIKKAIDPEKITPLCVDKKVVPICDLDIVLDPRDDKCTIDSFVPVFSKIFTERISATGRTITDFLMENSNEPEIARRFVIMVEDGYRNTFRCSFYMRDDYVKFRLGSCRGAYYADAEMPEEDITSEHINVRLRNGKVIKLPKGATAIDVAFRIHPEVGFSVKAAEINGQPASIYNILQDGDRIIVISDTYRENGVTKQFINHARISWLSYVATKNAKKKLIKYLSDKYEQDDPKNENNANDITVNTVADVILKNILNETT